MYRACVAIRSGGLVWDALALPVTCVNSRLGGLIWATNGGAKLSCLNFLPDLEAKKTGTVRTGSLCKRLKRIKKETVALKNAVNFIIKGSLS